MHTEVPYGNNPANSPQNNIQINNRMQGLTDPNMPKVQSGHDYNEQIRAQSQIPS